MKKNNVLFYISILFVIAPLLIFAVDTKNSVTTVLLFNALTKNGLLISGLSLVGLTSFILGYRKIYSEDKLVKIVRISVIDRSIHLFSLAIVGISLIAALSYFNVLPITTGVGTVFILTLTFIYLSGFLYEAEYYSKKRSNEIADVFDESSGLTTQYLIAAHILIILALVGLSFFAPSSMPAIRVSATLLAWNILFVSVVRKYLTRTLIVR